MSDKTLAVRIDEGLYKRIKIRLAETGLTLKDYVITLIETDLQQNEPFKTKTVPMNEMVSEEAVKEAQKVLDFVHDIIKRENGKQK